MQKPVTTTAAELGITDDLLVARGLRQYQEARELIIAEVGTDGREHQLISQAADAWRQLRSAANEAGINLFIVSAFRSIERQVAIIRRKLDAGISIEEILTVLAPPGFSEHHTGCAVDICTPGTAPATLEFETTAAFSWLMDNANAYGFYLSYPQGNPEGFQYEPWHWCFHPAQTTFTT
ncbi:MAG: M15 family metallopeptidase [Methylococcaceae bacterium]|nr:M15 family metallopeptidase [Methylococcaceae bacterium]